MLKSRFRATSRHEFSDRDNYQGYSTHSGRVEYLSFIAATLLLSLSSPLQLAGTGLRISDAAARAQTVQDLAARRQSTPSSQGEFVLPVCCSPTWSTALVNRIGRLD